MKIGDLSGIQLSSCTASYPFSWENLKVSTGCESPGIGGDSACSPEPLLRFAMVTYSGNYLSRWDAKAGAEALRAVAQKER